MDIYVKTLTGKVIPLTVKAEDLVSTITSQIQAKEKIPAVRQLLTFAGKPLDPEKTVEFYGIKKESVIKVEFLAPKTINLFVKTATGSVTPISVKGNENVRRIMEIMRDTQGINPDQLELEFNGKTLESGKTIDSYGIQEEAVLKATILPPKATSKSKSSYGSSGSSEEKVDKDKLMSSFADASNKVEIVFCFDTTGSMAPCIAEVRRELQNTCKKLMENIKDIRIGMIAHGDYCDDKSSYVIKTLDLTNNVKKICSFAESASATGGGDAPECAEYVLRQVQDFSWSDDSSKAIVIIGDDVCHEANYTSLFIDWKLECEHLAQMGIKIYGVQARGVHSNKHFYQGMADMTGGFYVPFSQFSYITDMFMAVCYKEAGEKHLEAFKEEITSSGKMEDVGMSTIMEALSAPAREATVFAEAEVEGKGKMKMGTAVKKPKVRGNITRATTPTYIYINGHFESFMPGNKKHQQELKRALRIYFGDDDNEDEDEGGNNASNDESDEEVEAETKRSGSSSSSSSSSHSSPSSTSSTSSISSVGKGTVDEAKSKKSSKSSKSSKSIKSIKFSKSKTSLKGGCIIA